MASNVFASPHSANVQSVADAYKCIGVSSSSADDKIVVAAFYKAHTAWKDAASSIISEPLKSLKVIADHRQSQWLAFIIAIVPHLTKENVSILAAEPRPPPAFNFSSSITDNGMVNVFATNETLSTSERPRASPEPFIFGNSATASTAQPSTILGTTETPPTNPPTADFDATSLDGSTEPQESEDASNYSEDLSSDASSSDYGSVLSRLPEPAGGKFWNGQVWCCAVCREELDDEGQCYDDHTMNPCGYCGKDFDLRDCTKFCDECHRELPEPCPVCSVSWNVHDDESKRPMEMIWDDKDGIWRCTACMWEIEANGEDEGQCHCLVDSDEVAPELSVLQGGAIPWQPVITTSRVRPIELLYYHDYEPADSDSSGEESTDEEPNSDDEWAIDDGPLEPDASLPAEETPEDDASTEIPNDDSVTAVLQSVDTVKG